MNGKFVWYEMMAEDVEKARAFYTETIGFKTQAWENGDTPYTMWMAGESAVGGLTKLPEDAKAMGAPPHWLAYTSVDDVDASVAKVTDLGGKILAPPFDVPSVGRISVAQDPQGAVFAMFKAEGDDPQQPSSDTVGAVCWHELLTTDLDAATDFYGEIFGWQKTQSMEMGEAGEYRMFGHSADKSLGGFMIKPELVPMTHWLYYFTTDDLEAATGRVTSNGGKVLVEPMDVPGGRVSVFVDNQGAVFALFVGTE